MLREDERLSRMKIEQRWHDIIQRLPPGLSLSQAARRLRRKYSATRHWLLRLDYPFTDGRQASWTPARHRRTRSFNWEQADWSKPNVLLARQHGVSRERIRQVRERLRVAKVNGRT